MSVPSGRHPVLVYTGLRFAILVGVGALLYLVGLRGLLLLVFAFLISGVVSIFALNSTREGAAWGITSGMRRLNERIDAGARAEDAEDEDDLAQYESAADVAPASESGPEQEDRNGEGEGEQVRRS